MLKKILSSAQIKGADKYTIKNEPITSIKLMERASNAFVDEIAPLLKTNQKIAVVCGTGNNGGDGLAIARILMWKGFDVYPFLFLISDHLSEDCQQNLEQLDNIISVEKNEPIPDFNAYDVLIDGLFGTGLNRAVEGWPAQIVDTINQSGKKVMAIDIPSGLFCDAIPIGNHIVKSDLVVSFQRPKLSFFFKESAEFIKSWKVVDIGLDESFIQNQDSNSFVLDKSIAISVNKREKFSHKGSYGHALIIAGMRGKMGAAVLSGRACLRSGVGLLTMHIPFCGLEIMQISIPEAMCSVDAHTSHFSRCPENEKYKSIGIGPGLGNADETKEALLDLMETTTVPLILDADALNVISEDKTLYALIPKDSILTPHIKEFERLAGTWSNSEERLEKQMKFSKKHNCIVVLKDAITIISDQKGNTYYNTTGNPGMATGGSGDVLTGIITGLLAQNYTPLKAAQIGVYYHGLAGDVAAKVKGESALMASDIVDALRIE